MHQRPLLATPELVHPILDLLKTETRRMNGLEYFNAAPDGYTFKHLDFDGPVPKAIFMSESGTLCAAKCPYGNVGDELWVRENWYAGKGFDKVRAKDLAWHTMLRGVSYGFMADGRKPDWAGKTRPSIFMPKYISRITLVIENLTVERLHDISDESAMREGIESGDMLGIRTWKDYTGLSRKGYFLEGTTYGYDNGKSIHTAQVASFCTLWHLVNDKASWDLNPWVWVIKFNLKTPQ